MKYNKDFIYKILIILIILILFGILIYIIVKNNKHIKKSMESFESNSNSSSESKIPKTIHQIWVGSDADKLPVHKKLYMSSFKQILGNSWDYKLWTDDDITPNNFPITYEYIQLIRGKPKKWAQVGDLMKFELIYHHGGFYFDTNIELIKDISYLADSSYDMILCNEIENEKQYMSCGFFASIPNSEYLKKLLSIDNLNNINFESNAASIESGPYFFIKAFKNTDIFNNSKIYVLPTKSVYPFHPAVKDTDKSINPDSSENIYETEFKGNSVKIKYPTIGYNDSIAIDHFYFGCSWC